MRSRQVIGCFWFVCFVLAVLLCGALAVEALPTAIAKKVVWDNYTDPAGTGFYLYWRTEASGTYSDSQRIDLGRPEPEEVVVLSFLPSAKGRICFQLTAYDVSRAESGFSNEACGFFGVAAPSGVKVEN